MVLAGVAVLLVGFVFFRFNPVEGGFFPRCAFHTMSGWDCPGCGGQRALHQLLHGNFGAALRCNAMLILLIPLAAWQLTRTAWRHLKGRPLPNPFGHHLWAWVICVGVILFGVVRNLPGFEWLRP